ncbi:chondroitin sulfate glucuronyltransferase isoform X1 [Hydra vulgaris]|nr:chondroitin sulfate glucuronyltransferase [Hydra vulgaris]XP_012562843.1 chondroitin sulfate glucuronyltransferase [Hydra vulgaris]
MKSEIITMRRNFRLKQYLPFFIGILIGCIISFFYNPIYKDSCVFSIQVPTTIQKHISKSIEENQLNSVPVYVKPKSTRFNYDFRPYFVYSELGFRFQFIVAVITTEERLMTYGIAINNTWLPYLPRVVFFTVYSKNLNFHNHFNTKLNLNVIQLSDINEESTKIEFSFRVLQYMKDHFVDSYSWFMLVSDEVYIRSNEMLKFLHSLNSSAEYYIGYPMPKSHSILSSGKNEFPAYYCYEQSGFIISRATLLKFETLPMKSNKNIGETIGESFFRTSKVECIHDKEVKDLFLVDKSNPFTIESVSHNEKVNQALLLYPVQSAREMIEIDKHFTLKNLHSTFKDINYLQQKIVSIREKLPEGVPEKLLHWPIGFPHPFKPLSRFEVIEWMYFDLKYLYGQKDAEPVSEYDSANKKDISDIIKIAEQALQFQHNPATNYHYELVNGYRRLDPQRGAEYIIDMFEGRKGFNVKQLKRVSLLKPFTHVEALQMPAATEQKGIHLILPVLKEDVAQHERFLQMYKRVCLQTGENVVLLTVFINIRFGQFEGEDKDDPFVDSKNLIARYKQSYMWAQLPWLQVGVKKPSPTLLMDIVSMKLPSNALIFLVNLTVDFTINFLNRCRVNVVNGMQVFFPIPFAEYNPMLVYKTKHQPAFVDIHRNNGYWDESTDDIACFNNKDYKDIRMLLNDFLDENQPVSSLLEVFKKSRLSVFRAVDSDLRRRYTSVTCNASETTQYSKCISEVGPRTGFRNQLAQIIFQKERSN